MILKNRKYFILLSFLFFTFNGYTQSFTIKVEYDFYRKTSNLNVYNSILLINKTESYFVRGVLSREEKNTENDFSIKIKDNIGGYNYTNFLRDSLYTRIPHLNEIPFLLKEAIPKIKWKIINEFRKIGDFHCQKAEAEFRGREYTAWFTQDISINAGPWKLHGLPGLIVNVSDSKKEIVFTLKSIKNTKQLINPYFEKSKLISLEEYKIIQKKLPSDLMSKISSKLPRGAKVELKRVSNTMEIFKKR